MNEVKELIYKHAKQKPADRHRLFIEYLLSDPERNATKNYLKVYPNCSYDVARSNAAQLLAKSSIQEIITKRSAELLEKSKLSTEITKDLILTQIQTDRADAKSDKQHSVAMKGNELLARMQGYLVDKSINLSMSLEDFIAEREKAKETNDE